MAKIVKFGRESAAAPEHGAPKPERLLEGNPASRTWNFYEGQDGKTFCGLWESTPGRWIVEYEEWESCTLLSGRSIVTAEGGTPIDLGPGDTLVVEPGFRGTWEVVETTRKSYVIRL